MKNDFLFYITATNFHVQIHLLISSLALFCSKKSVGRMSMNFLNPSAVMYQKYMALKSNVKRMDSLMIASRCKRMSRLEIIYTTTTNAVRLLHQLGNEDLIPKELLHYLEGDDYN